MNQDQLIQALATHLDPQAVLEAKNEGRMFSYYVELAQKILGNNQTTQRTTRQPARQAAVVREEAVDLNETNEQPVRQTARTAAAPRPARQQNTNTDRVRVGRL